MTLLYTQGFEGYDIAGFRSVLERDFNYNFNTTSTDVGLIAGRTGGIAAFANSSYGQSSGTHGHWIPVAGLSSEDDWVVGFAFYNDHEEFRLRSPLLQFSDSDRNVMLSVYPASGTLNVRNGGTSGVTKLGFADALISTKVWHYLEVKVNFHATTGSVVIHLNEEEVMNVTGVNTVAASTGDVRPSTVAIGGATTLNDFWVDDIYILDDQGSQHNDFLGDIRIDRLNADLSGATSQFVGSDADSTNNYLLVNEDVIDEADYVESATVGNKDTYRFGDLGASVTPANVEAVSVKSWVSKSDAGSRNFVHIALSGTELDSSVLYPATTPRYMESIYPMDPNSGSPVVWDKTSVNGAEFGYKVNA